MASSDDEELYLVPLIFRKEPDPYAHIPYPQECHNSDCYQDIERDEHQVVKRCLWHGAHFYHLKCSGWSERRIRFAQARAYRAWN